MTKKLDKKIKHLCLFFLILFLNQEAYCDNEPLGARANGMGKASVVSYDVWATHNNQAGLCKLNSITTSISYENNYSMSKLATKAFVLGVPTKTGVFGLSLSNYGYELFNYTKTGIAFSKSLSPKFSAGVQLDYLRTSLGDIYGNSNNFTFEIGLIASLSENIHIGTHIFNPVEVKLNDYNNEKIPSIIKIGFAYLLGENAIFVVEGEKNSYTKPIFRGGFEYLIIKQLFFRAGVETISNISNLRNSPKFSFGFGINISNFKLDIASSIHPVLGYSPSISLLYNFKKL